MTSTPSTPKLTAELEALMPEPVKLVTACEDCCGTGHTGESQYMGEFQPPEYERCSSCDGSGRWIVDHHSPDQVRQAILDATERAARKCDEPFGYVLHWPKIGGGVSLLFDKSRVAGDAIGCKVTPVYEAMAAIRRVK